MKIEINSPGLEGIHEAPGAVLIGQNVDDFLQKPAGDDIVPASGSCDQVVAHLLLLPSVHLRLSALRLFKQNTELVKIAHS